MSTKADVKEKITRDARLQRVAMDLALMEVMRLRVAYIGSRGWSRVLGKSIGGIQLWAKDKDNGTMLATAQDAYNLQMNEDMYSEL